MKDKLNKLLKRAHGTYSGVQVAAIVLTNAGNFSGVNVENAAYPSSMCAERNAIFNAVTEGMKVGGLKEVHLTSNLKKKNLFPCAGCLQVMLEFMPATGQVHMYHKNEILVHELRELIPYGVTVESFEWK